MFKRWFALLAIQHLCFSKVGAQFFVTILNEFDKISRGLAMLFCCMILTLEFQRTWSTCCSTRTFPGEIAEWKKDISNTSMIFILCSEFSHKHCSSERIFLEIYYFYEQFKWEVVIFLNNLSRKDRVRCSFWSSLKSTNY